MKNAIWIIYVTKWVLIETYWNVNIFNIFIKSERGQRINRNILECKCEIVGVHLTGFDDVLIETYWNVKLKKDKLLCVRKAVLIETYWNVKVLSAGGSGAL